MTIAEIIKRLEEIEAALFAEKPENAATRVITLLADLKAQPEVLADDRDGTLRYIMRGDSGYWTLDWYPFWDVDKFERNDYNHIPVHVTITRRALPGQEDNP